MYAVAMKLLAPRSGKGLPMGTVTLLPVMPARVTCAKCHRLPTTRLPSEPLRSQG